MEVLENLSLRFQEVSQELNSQSDIMRNAFDLLSQEIESAKANKIKQILIFHQRIVDLENSFRMKQSLADSERIKGNYTKEVHRSKLLSIKEELKSKLDKLNDDLTKQFYETLEQSREILRLLQCRDIELLEFKELVAKKNPITLIKEDTHIESASERVKYLETNFERQHSFTIDQSGVQLLSKKRNPSKENILTQLEGILQRQCSDADLERLRGKTHLTLSFQMTQNGISKFLFPCKEKGLTLPPSRFTLVAITSLKDKEESPKRVIETVKTRFTKFVQGRKGNQVLIGGEINLSFSVWCLNLIDCLTKVQAFADIAIDNFNFLEELQQEFIFDPSVQIVEKLNLDPHKDLKKNKDVVIELLKLRKQIKMVK